MEYNICPKCGGDINTLVRNNSSIQFKNNGFIKIQGDATVKVDSNVLKYHCESCGTEWVK